MSRLLMARKLCVTRANCGASVLLRMKLSPQKLNGSHKFSEQMMYEVQEAEMVKKLSFG